MNDNKNFLPTAENWKKWFEVEKQFDVLDLLKPEVLAVLLCCIEYQVVRRRPPILDELYKHLNDTCNFFFPHIDSLNSKSASTRSLLLRNLEEKKIISIITVQEWRKKYPLDEKINGKAVFYSLTGKGVVLFELLLCFPFYSFSLVPYWHKSVTISQSTLAWGISSKLNRVRYSEEFFIKNNIEIKKFDSDIFSKTSKVLGAFEDIFWKMSNPLTTILRERSTLKMVTMYFYVPEHRQEKLNLPNNATDSSKIGEVLTNYKAVAIDEIRNLGAIYFTLSLLPKLKKYSLSEDIFESNSPKITLNGTHLESADYLCQYILVEKDVN